MNLKLVSGSPLLNSMTPVEMQRYIERLRAALKPFAEWDESDSSTHGFLSDPDVWAAAKAAYSSISNKEQRK